MFYVENVVSIIYKLRTIVQTRQIKLSLSQKKKKKKKTDKASFFFGEGREGETIQIKLVSIIGIVIFL